MQYLSDNAYLAIKPEATAGVAVTPTIMLPLVSESIRTVVNHSADQRMKGINWKANGLLRGFRSHEGEVVVLADPDTLGHFLNMTFTKGSTTGNATDGYSHPFTVGTPDTYTIDIKKGDHVVRYFGVMVDELKLDFSDGQLQITASISALGQFSVAKLGVTSAGAVTSVTLDDDYDIAPNRGLAVGDVIDVDGVALTLSSVDANGIAVGFSSTTVGKSAGATVKLKPQAVSFSTLQDPFYFGNLLVGFGADESEATTNATQANSTPLYDLSISFKNNLFKQNGSNRIDPVLIAPRTREAQIEVKQLFENADQRKAWLNRSKQAITMKFFGKFIKADFTTQELFTLKFHNVQLLENDNPLSVGEFIQDEQKFEVLYDNADAKALTMSLVNRTAGTDY